MIVPVKSGKSDVSVWREISNAAELSHSNDGGEREPDEHTGPWEILNGERDSEAEGAGREIARQPTRTGIAGRWQIASGFTRIPSHAQEAWQSCAQGSSIRGRL